MKAFKWIFILLSYLSLSPIYGQDFIALDKYIDEFHIQLENKKDSVEALYRANMNLKDILPDIKKCIEDENTQIKKITAQQNYLKKAQTSQYLIDQNTKILSQLKIHQDALNLCQLISYKVDNLRQDIQNYNEALYQKNFFKKNDNIFVNFSKQDFSKLQIIPIGFAYKGFLTQSNFKRNLEVFFIYFAIVCLLKVLIFFKKLNVKPLTKLSLTKFLYVGLVFLIVAPVQFLLFKTGYAHRDEVLLALFNRPLTYLLSFCFFHYLYFYSRFDFSKKGILGIFITLFLQILSIRYFYYLNYLALQQSSLDQILFCKYIILLLMFMIIFLLFYWSFNIILSIKLKKYIKLISVFMVFEAFLMFLGLLGYVDMVININLSLATNIVLMVWIIVLSRLKNNVIEYIKRPHTQFHQTLNLYFENYAKKVIFNLKIELYLLYIISVICLVVSIFSCLSFFSTIKFVEVIYKFLFFQYSINNFDFRIINFLYAIQALFILNILNYFISMYLAKQLFLNSVAVEQTAKVFSIIGYAFEFILILAIAGFKFQNFQIILGGVFFGIGIGANEIISSLISSIILFVNRPFEVNDYVSINQTKGYVKKLNLMETIIETTDKNIVILPNQNVAKSIIYNFSYGHKKSHYVHLKYIAQHLSLKDEKKVKTRIEKILKEDINIIFTKKSDFTCIFSPEDKANDSTEFEVIFSFDSLEKINENITKINYQILQEMKNLKLDVRFDSLQHPLKEQYSTRK